MVPLIKIQLKKALIILFRINNYRREDHWKQENFLPFCSKVTMTNLGVGNSRILVHRKAQCDVNHRAGLGGAGFRVVFSRRLM